MIYFELHVFLEHYTNTEIIRGTVGITIVRLQDGKIASLGPDSSNADENRVLSFDPGQDLSCFHFAIVRVSKESNGVLQTSGVSNPMIKKSQARITGLHCESVFESRVYSETNG